MDITQQLLGAVPVIRIDGELDRLNSPALEKAFRVHGLLAIVAPSVSIRRLLDVVGLYEHKRSAIFTAEPEALSSILAMSPEATFR